MAKISILKRQNTKQEIFFHTIFQNRKMIRINLLCLLEQIRWQIKALKSPFILFKVNMKLNYSQLLVNVKKVYRENVLWV